MQQSETKFKARVLNDLWKVFQERCKPLKTQERGRRGVPDLLLCLCGDYIAIELKVDGCKPDKLQEHFLKDVQIAGGGAFSTTPSEWSAHLELLKDRYAKRL